MGTKEPTYLRNLKFQLWMAFKAWKKKPLLISGHVKLKQRGIQVFIHLLFCSLYNFNYIFSKYKLTRSLCIFLRWNIWVIMAYACYCDSGQVVTTNSCFCFDHISYNIRKRWNCGYDMVYFVKALLYVALIV